MGKKEAAEETSNGPFPGLLTHFPFFISQAVSLFSAHQTLMLPSNSFSFLSANTDITGNCTGIGRPFAFKFIPLPNKEPDSCHQCARSHCFPSVCSPFPDYSNTNMRHLSNSAHQKNCPRPNFPHIDNCMVSACIRLEQAAKN